MLVVRLWELYFLGFCSTLIQNRRTVDEQRALRAAKGDTLLGTVSKRDRQLQSDEKPLPPVLNTKSLPPLVCGLNGSSTVMRASTVLQSRLVVAVKVLLRKPISTRPARRRVFD